MLEPMGLPYPSKARSMICCLSTAQHRAWRTFSLLKGSTALFRYSACTRFMVPSSTWKSSPSWATWVLVRWANMSMAPLCRLITRLSAFSMIRNVTLSSWAGVPQ